MIAELTNHLWQSTVFAILAGLITLAFHRNRAQVRYGLWLSASLKFLLPFSLLMTFGHRLERASGTHSIAPAPAVRLAVAQWTQPFPETLPQPPSTRAVHDWTAIAMFGLWACGFAALTVLRLRGWRRIRAAVRSSRPIDVLGTMQVRSSPGLLEPGVVGLFHPILLLPTGIAERLQPPQLKAVLAHELCHARRRDNLTSAVHMIVETVFWFHPLVWWIGARLIEERERACDEAVLSLGSEPLDYAEGILTVCKSYVESPLSLVSGVTGANLKKRIHAILTGRIAADLNFAKKLALAAAAIAAVAIPIAAGIMSSPGISAQARPAAPRFETASIKSCDFFRRPNPELQVSRDMGRREFQGTFESQCTTTERLIQQAYGLPNGRVNLSSSVTVAGGPPWTRSDLYEIHAKANGTESQAMMNGPLLQALLEDRFKLKVHHDLRKVPVYALTVAEGGLKLEPFQGSCTPRDFDKPPSKADCGSGGSWGDELYEKAATLADLCVPLSVFMDRHVVDETGITGRFNITLKLPPEDHKLLTGPRSLPASSDPTVPARPSLPFNDVKMAMKTLGLNLEPTDGTSEFIAIDHIEKPSRD
jgi:bla regulator protein blaR1